MASFHGKALLIDNNYKFLDLVKGDEKLLENYPCLFSKTFLEATNFLKQSKHQIRVIFLSTNISPSHGIEEIKYIRQERPHVPIFLVTHAPDKEPSEVRSPELGYVKLIESPENYQSMVRVIDELFSNKEFWNKIQASAEEKDVELNLVDENYVPTFLTDFVLTPKSFFNVFIRLGQAKFIKVLNAGDPLNQELLMNYAKKGIRHLYIPTDEHKKYIALCDELSRKILGRMEVALGKKIKNVINLGANISQNLQHTGITPDKLDFANSFLDQSVSMIKNMRIQSVTLKNFLENIEMQEHGSAVSFLAGLIANEVGFESSKMVKLVGLAALVHDIGLFDLDPTFTDENVYRLSDGKKDIFDQHHKHGADILRKDGSFDEIICLAVEQHHMRRRGKDPSNRSLNINLITEIIGVADELQNAIKIEAFNQARINEFILTTLPDFSPQIEKAVANLLKK